MRSIRRKVVFVGAIGAAALGGGAIANAATSGTTGATGSPTPPTAQTRPAMPAPGTAAHEDAEKTVTGTDATKAQAAAVKDVGSGTAGAVTTDFTGNGYEVTVTKADGSTVDVHLDSSFNVQQGPGGAGGQGGPGAGHPGAGPGRPGAGPGAGAPGAYSG